MTSFAFSPEATLYAREVEIVEEMRKRFEANLGEFFEAVTAELQGRPWPARFGTFRQGRSWYALVSRLDAPSTELEPCVWTYWADAGVIRDRGVYLRVGHSGGSEEEKARLRALAQHPAFAPPKLQCTSASKWQLIELWLPWREGDDPVKATADALDPVLRAIDAAR